MKKVLFLGGELHDEVHIVSEVEELYTDIFSGYSQTYGGSNGFAIYTHNDTTGGEHVKMIVELVECNTHLIVEQRHAFHTLKLKNHDLKAELETVSAENAALRQKVHELEIQRDAAVLTLTSGS